MTAQSEQQAREWKPVRSPVLRFRAEEYVLTSLVTFAVTVMATRIFLELTGYPQVGNSVLHIAHAIWGGLLLFVAVLLPLIFGNGWALAAGAVVSGIGVGLFIDEVGKFITQTNDYFFPPAAPIIYAFFLLAVLVYLTVRRRERQDPRRDLYRVLETLPRALDNTLQPRERAWMLDAVAQARTTDAPHVAALAQVLEAYLQDPAVATAPDRPGFWQRLSARVRHIGGRVGRRVHRALVLLFLFISGLFALFSVAVLLAIVLFGGELAVPGLLIFVVTAAESASVQDPGWYAVRIVLETAAGLMAFAGWVLIVRGHEARGVRVGILSQLLSLTTVVPLTFYLDQFGALATAVFQFFLLGVLLTYRSWYLRDDEQGDSVTGLQ